MSQPIPQTDHRIDADSRWYQAAWVTVLRAVVAVFAIFVGLGIVLLGIVVGHCSAFGGTCPRQSGFPDDVFGSAAFGGALAAAVPYFLKRPTWKRLAISLPIGIAAGMAIGLFAVSATAG